MKTPLERATTRVEQQYKRNPEAVQLAKLASLAVRVEPHLLRRLRLELLPDADVGIEADLWFGPLVESRGVRAIVLNRYVVELLREKLAEDRQLLRRVIAITEQAHAEAATTIRLEERLMALAVLNEPDARQQIDEALRPALRTMQVGGEDARQLAQWAMRALSQAHRSVRETRNAVALGLSATLALGGRPILREVPKLAGDLGDMSWLLHGAISVPPTRIGVELVADGVAFAEPGGGHPQLELPATNPLVLWLAWKTDGGDAQMLVEAVPGRTVELDADVTQVEIRTLSGDEYLLSAVSPVESSPEATSEDWGARHFDIDVFISYARIDNQPLSKEKGWVTMLRDTLQALLSMRTGSHVNIWMDQKLRGTDEFEFSNEAVSQFSKTAVMVSVLSPAYLNSDWCMKEVNQFCQVAEQSGGVAVDNKSRVFKVIKSPFNRELTQKLPHGVRETLGYEFFEITEYGMPREFDPNYGEESHQNFQRKLGKVAWDINELLKRLTAGPLPQTPAKQSSGIFVSYRRDDAGAHAGRLIDKLAEHFGKDRVLMDVNTIQPGEDFATAMENAISSCEILIVIIGRDWLSAASEDGRRLDDPNDFVRLEIAHALNRGIQVIPVLVQRAIMPQQRDLPHDLARLARRNAIELTDLRWQHDVDQLISVVEQILAGQEGKARQRIAATEPERKEAREEGRAKQLSKIFVSYHRHASGQAGRLREELVNRFGRDRIAVGVDTFRPGENFIKVIENAVNSCDILIAIIDPRWLLAAGDTAVLMDESRDFVFIEIAHALRRGIRVIPVLVEGASMPELQDLPDNLALITRRNAIELREARWQADVYQLFSAMERILAEKEAEAVRQTDEEIGHQEERVRLDLPTTLHSISGAEMTGPGPYTLWQLIPLWITFEEKIIEGLKLNRSAHSELGEKIRDAFEIDVLSIFVSAWKPAMRITLLESKQKRSAVSWLELPEHSITNEPQISFVINIKNAPQRIELAVRLAFRLKSFRLKIENGMITEIQTGTCAVDGRVFHNTLPIAEIGTPIKLPPSISVAADAGLQ